MRKKMILIMLLLYFMAFPPLIRIYNHSGFICGIPTFVFGVLVASIGMVVSTLILFRYEEKHKKNGEQK